MKEVGKAVLCKLLESANNLGGAELGTATGGIVRGLGLGN